MTEPTLTLLLCFDGSDRAERAIEQAARLFPASRAHVLNVWEPWEHVITTHAVPVSSVPPDVGDLDRRAAEESATLAERGAAVAECHGLRATALSAGLQGSLWETVTQTADELGADLIVTGTRGLHGLRELLSHSLTHQLEQHGDRPVLAIPLPHPAHPTAPPRRGHRQRVAGDIAVAALA